MHTPLARPTRLLSTTTRSSKWVRWLAAAVYGWLSGVLPAHAARGPSHPAPTPMPASEASAASDPFESPHDGYVPVHVPDVSLPDPRAGRPVSLEAILAHADRHAPVLAVATARVGLGDAAQAGAKPRLPANPSVTLGAGPRFTSNGTFTDLYLTASQQVEIAGEPRRRREAASRTRDRLVAELDETRWEIHRDVHAAFHRALVARERQAAAQRLLAFQERLVDITQRRLQAGDVSPLAVRLAQGELSQARVARIDAEQVYRRACLQLGLLAGWPTEHPPEPAGSLDVPRDPPAAYLLVDAARTHQPRLRTLDAARVESSAYAETADRDAWPEPTFGVQATRESALPGFDEVVVLGTVSLPIPLFQRNQGPRATAHAQVKVAEQERHAFGRVLLNRIEQHRTAVVAAAARVRTYGSEILPTFEENLRLLQRAFELGEIDIVQVSVARERFLRLQTDALDAYVDYFQAVADLEGSIGTDLWPDERHDHVPTDGGQP